ncbi:MAG: hypothetical protein ACTSWE_03035 [Promethearchaeota archaeon]
MLLPRILNTPLTNIEFKAGGLNHFGVIFEASYRDTRKNAYPHIRANAIPVLEKFGKGEDYELIKFILKTYDYLPYTTDDHYGEYISWAWEVADLIHGREFWEGYEKRSMKQYERIKKYIEKGRGNQLVKPDGERAIPIMEEIITDSHYEELSVNLPNDDVITNLPRDLVIECPAIVTKEGLNPIKLGEYLKGLAALLRTQASVQDLVVEAILQKSKKIAY